MSDRLTNHERNQIRDHRPSCPCDLCQRYRNEIGIGTERERLLLEQCEQMVGDRLSGQLFPITPEFITATEIEQARGSLNPTQWQQEYLAELPPPAPPRRDRRFMLIAGSHCQADRWRRSRELTWHDCVYVYNYRDLCGRRGEDFELVRVGQWWLNPVLCYPKLTMLFPDWHNSPIEDSPRQQRHSEVRFTIQVSGEAVQRMREAFEDTRRSLEQIEQMSPTVFEQARDSLQRGLEALAQSRLLGMLQQPNPYNPLNQMHIFQPPRYGKRIALREAQIQTWCEQSGYTEPFCQEGEWWAFPPAGVMPVQLATVMGEERSPF